MEREGPLVQDKIFGGQSRIKFGSKNVAQFSGTIVGLCNYELSGFCCSRPTFKLYLGSYANTFISIGVTNGLK